MDNESQFMYEGLIKVDKGAQGTNAYQKDDNLLLSKKVIVETKPALEILANDVRCTHGAATGRINSDELFYPQSREVSQKLSTEMIAAGFVTQIAERISDEKIKEKVTKKIYQILTVKN